MGETRSGEVSRGDIYPIARIRFFQNRKALYSNISYCTCGHMTEELVSAHRASRSAVPDVNPISDINVGGSLLS